MYTILTCTVTSNYSVEICVVKLKVISSLPQQSNGGIKLPEK